jgi:Uncharacterized protein conserved in bacteria (DUF2325)
MRKVPGLHTRLPMLPVKVGSTPRANPCDGHMRVQTTPAAPKRRRIWEISSNVHCSIIGTCLTTAELRQVLVKIQLAGAHTHSDHELHGQAVLLAGRRDHASKLLQKALDRRHRSAIGQFGKARNVEDLRNLWTSAVQRADIPGAYWAILTHPLATEDLMRHVFGDVHMLSHLVGAANRADIRRLRELEIETAALQDKVARQQRQLRDAVVSRDATIANLTEALSKAIASHSVSSPANGGSGESESETTAELVRELRKRLASRTASCEEMQRRLQRLMAEFELERKRRHGLERRESELRDELEAAERSLVRQVPVGPPSSERSMNLAGVTILYVGGCTNNVVQLRILSEEYGAAFLHHDGGVDDRSGLLASQVAQADLVYFPVDCVSHNAVAVVKRMARQLGKPFVALRSSGLTSFVSALRRDASARTGNSPNCLQSRR